MKRIYHIAGMTCNGCRATVEKQLANVAGVTHVTVRLETAQAIIEAKTQPTIAELQQQLSAKYTITTSPELKLIEEKAVPKWKQLFPLFLIFTYILTAAFLLHAKAWNTRSFMLDAMGLFYIVFSFFKFLDLKGFSTSFTMYDPMAKAVPLYGWVYPFIELLLGLMFLMRFKIPVALVATIIILGITTVGVTKVLLQKQTLQCACLGTALKLPMTTATFIENSVMIVMAIVVLIQ